MKNKILLSMITALTLLIYPNVNFGQVVAPTLGKAADYALLTSAGAVKSVSTLKYLTYVTGNLGAPSGQITGFGNVDGVVVDPSVLPTEFSDAVADMLAAYAQLNAPSPGAIILASPFGGGSVLVSGIYQINSASQLTGDIILDAQNNSSAVFIFKLQGALGISANAKIKLINGALACNVFWKVEGAITMAPGVSMKGTIVANAGAVLMDKKDTLEGRVLVINEAITVDETVIKLPIGCGSPDLTGPIAPTLASAECFGIFSSLAGDVTDDFGSFVTGDIGTNGAGFAPLGYDPLKVSGSLYAAPTGTASLCASDLASAYGYVLGLSHDILLLEPTLFGHDLVLTPHTYRIDGAVTFTDSVYLDGQGNPDAVFVIKIYGAFGSSTNSKVVLINGTQAKNVYWMINGAVSIGINSIFNGSFISAGAIDLLLNTTMNGRAFTTSGVIKTYSITLNIPSGKAAPSAAISGAASVCKGQSGVIYTVPPINGATGYTWTLPSGATIVAGNNTNSITVDFSAIATSGNITVQGTASCSNGAVSANFGVTVNSMPTVNNIADQSVCNNASTVTIAFSGSEPLATYDWTNNNISTGLAAMGTGDIISFNATNPGTTDISSTVTVTPKAGGCDGPSKNFTITVKPTPTANNVINQVLCNNTNTTLITFGGAVAGTTYNWTNDNISIGLGANGTGDINSFSANNAGIIAEIATIVVTPTANLCDGATETFTITVNPTPTANNVTNQVVCNNANTTLITFGGAVAGTTYNWSNDNTSIGLGANGTGDINSFTAINTGIVQVTATITVIPTANLCDGAAENFTISVDPTPIAVANGNSPVCVGSAINLTAGTVLGATYSWTGPNGYTSSAKDSVISSAAMTNDGTYSLVVTTNGCPSAPSTVTVVVNNCIVIDLAVVNTVNNYYPVVGNTVVFTVVATNNGPDKASLVAVTDILQSGYSYVSSSTTRGLFDNSTGTWSIDSLRVGESEILTIRATVLASGNYVSTASINGNEPEVILGNNESSITLYPTDFHIPEGFSPNNDGINDVFFIRGIDSYPNNKLTIFNRWGDKVFETNSYKNTWNGQASFGVTVGGNDLPIGTYFYTLDLGDGSNAFKGTIYLNR